MFTLKDHQHHHQRQQQQKQQSHPAVRCAVALNNVGCVLLGSGRPEPAHATFQDALRVVKRLVEEAAEENGWEDDASLQSTRYAQETLRQAERRLVGCPTAASPPPPPSAGAPRPTLMYDASSPSPQIAASHLLRGSPYALRIEVSGPDDAQKISVDVLSTILLINLVNAGRGVAGAQEDEEEVRAADPSAQQQRPGAVGTDWALKIMGLANALAERCHDDEDGGDSVAALFLVLVALDTTVQVHAEAGMLLEAAALRSRVEDLKLYVERTLGFLFAPAAAASAA